MSAILTHPLDERIARAAVSWSMDPLTAPDETADRLLALARGNRTAVERALGRIGKRAAPITTASGRAAHVLQLTLARGEWQW